MEAYKVHKRLSPRARSRLRDNETVLVEKRGDDPRTTPPIGTRNDVLLRSQFGWFGWMTIGTDLELKALDVERSRRFRS